MKRTMKFLAAAIVLLFMVMGAHAQNSVLSSGDWYKVSVEETGVHQITYDDLVSYGIDPGQINPKHIRLYGNGNGMLPEANDEFRYDDLQENSIFVSGEDDGVFDPGDFILFYGQGPTEWELNEETGLFEHQVNLYSDSTYYFINTDLGLGKRIGDAEEPSGDPTHYVSAFNNYLVHELELENLISSGKDWYGERFGEATNYNFAYAFPGLYVNQKIHLKSVFAHRSFEIGEMEITHDGSPISNVILTTVAPSSVIYARGKTDTVSFYLNYPGFDLAFTYPLPADSSKAWLDYFELNFETGLVQDYDQFGFRDVTSVGEGNISMFEIGGADANIEVWDVTDPLNVNRINGSFTGSDYGFKIETDNLHEFVAFNDEGFLSPGFSGMIQNQNLHGAEAVDFVIVSNELFMDAANELGQFHENNDGLSWMVVTPNQLYNEFSSGSQDVSAIRDFVRNMYVGSNGQQPKYLLLFGDGSYDPKNRVENNTNYIPVFQTKESLNRAGSIVTDDYFGFLDEDEGDDATGTLDIGIGRIPVKTANEASDFVSKIIHYATSTETFGDWKNNVCFVADDEDGNLHINQADSLDYYMADYNNKKLYFDFYEQVQTAEGPRYPEAKTILGQQVEDGVFVVNYTGHGHYYGWASEKVLESEDIQSWDNVDKLPLMITATCDFVHFDNPAFVSGAELAVLKSGGGVIGLIGTSRLSYSLANFNFSQDLLGILTGADAHTKTLGDFIMQSKPTGSTSTRNFVLLGDPALKLSFPEYQIMTESINGIYINEPLDTINPYGNIIVTGFITDKDGNNINGFNGEMIVKVYDRARVDSTMGNDPNSVVAGFSVQETVLSEFDVNVANGQFIFNYQLPYQMDPEYGTIKLSYYANDGLVDASGHFSQIVVGGTPNAIGEHKLADEFISFYPTIVSNQLNYLGKQDVDN
ncbi:MAG: hypothetical protein DRJ05_13280, partial [Bacteroidetes bacterium]